MNIKTFITIFLIFNQNFIFININCEFISISRKDYDLSGFDEGLDFIPAKQVGNKDVFAFNYYFFDNFKDNVNADFFKRIESIVSLEKQKFTPDFLLYILDYLFPGNDNETEWTEVNKQIEELKDDKIIKALEEYKAIKNEKLNLFKIGKKTVKKSLYYGTTVFSVKTTLPLLAKKILSTNGLSKLALSNPYVAGIIFIGIPIIIGIGSKIYNGSIDNKIQNEKKWAYKLTGLFFQIKDNLKKLRWINNNMVLAALSRDKESANYASKFDYYKGINYTDEKGIKKYMSKLTCSFRSNCNYSFCRQNLEKYLKCKEKEIVGKVEDCPEFNDDCSLDEY